MRVDTTGSVPGGLGGQETDAATATVSSGENTLAQVALRLGMNPQDLQTANPQITNPNALTPGLEIQLPKTTTLSAPSQTASDEVSAEIPQSPTSKLMESSMDAVAVKAMFGSNWGNSPGVAMFSSGGTSGSGGITQQPPVADPVRGEGYTAQQKQEMKDQLNALYQRPEFRALTQDEKSAVMQGLAGNYPITQEKISKLFDLIHSAQGLSPANHQLVMEAFKAGHTDPTFATHLQHLIEDPKFKSLSNTEKTAVLSQVKNYPDVRALDNIDRMLHKQWFTDQPLEDQQRSLKTIARLSSYDKGDRNIIDNTLNKLLDPASHFVLQWDKLTGKDKKDSGKLYGTGGDDTVTLNEDMVAKGNEPMVENDDTDHLTLHTVAHEVNHLINGDVVSNKFQNFNDEYRAWVTGFRAQHGRMPTNEEAMDERIKWQLSPRSGYGKHAAEAMKDPAEAQKFFDFLSQMTGLKVDAHNWKDVVYKSNPNDWPNLSVFDAPEGVGNHDNH